MLRASRPARAIIDLAGRRLRGRDQVCCALEAGLIVGNQPPLHRRNQRHRLEILQDVPAHLGLQVWHHRHDAVIEPANRVTVRLGAGDGLRPDQS
jgi:hypothetical protein